MKKENNFNFARLVLSLSILLVHSGGITNAKPLFFILNYLNGDVIVKCFFAISGYLVALSCQRSNLKIFFLKRAIRILPAYYMVIILMIIMGFVVTDIPKLGFITNSDTLKYMISNVIFLNFIHPTLPGVFDGNVLTAMNGSLWTIKSEIILYFLTPLFLVIPGKRIAPFIAIYLVSIGWVIWFSMLHISPSSRTMSLQFVGMASYYFIGSMIALTDLKKRHLFLGCILALMIFALSTNDLVRLLSEPFAITLAILTFCVGIPYIGNPTKSIDLSYGIYLYNFPVIQIFIKLGLYQTHPYLAVALSIMVTIIMAYFSWTFVERKCLTWK